MISKRVFRLIAAAPAPRILFVCSLVALLALAGVALVESRRAASELSGRVISVLDGDTVVVLLASGEPVHVRLIGVDTPEIAHFGRPGQCFGIRAARLARRLALGRQVLLRPGRERHDRYGRLLAYVRVFGALVDLEHTLLARGAARTLAIAPNVDRAVLYAGLERTARLAGRGLWGACPVA